MYRGDRFSGLSRSGLGAEPTTQTQEDWSISPFVSPLGWAFQKVTGGDKPIPLAVSPLLWAYQHTEKAGADAIKESIKPLKYLPWLVLAAAGVYLYAKSAGGRAAMQKLRG